MFAFITRTTRPRITNSSTASILRIHIRRVDVPDSQFAFALRGQQIRYLAVVPKQAKPIDHIELIKDDQQTAPVVMAITIESPIQGHK